MAERVNPRRRTGKDIKGPNYLIRAVGDTPEEKYLKVRERLIRSGITMADIMGGGGENHRRKGIIDIEDLLQEAALRILETSSSRVTNIYLGAIARRLAVDNETVPLRQADGEESVEQRYNSPERIIEENDMIGEIDAVLGTLTRHEEMVVRMSTGLFNDKFNKTIIIRDSHTRVKEIHGDDIDGDYPMSFPTIGKSLGVGRSRISQISAKAIRELQYPVRYKKLEDYKDLFD